METGSQILNEKGDPALAYGSAGTPSTAAPIGILDFDNNVFNTLNTHVFLKNKEEYEQKKKDIDQMYQSAKDLDLATDKLLDVDRQILVQDYIPKITNYLKEHPYALNPKTPAQIKENMEFKQILDDFKVAKAKAQVRYAAKPTIDQDIVSDPASADDKRAWYDKQFNTPFAYINPYQKVYKFDQKTLAGPDEEIGLEYYDGIKKKTDKIKSNLNTTINNAYRKLEEGDKAYNKYIDDTYDSYLKAYTATELQRKELASAGQTDEANKILPFATREINAANNYIAEWNKFNPGKTPIPQFDPTKPLTKEQFAILGAMQGVKQEKIDNKVEMSDFYKLNAELQAAKERVQSGSSKAAPEDYLVYGLSPFMLKGIAKEYEESKVRYGQNTQTMPKVALKIKSDDKPEMIENAPVRIIGTGEKRKAVYLHTDGKYYVYEPTKGMWYPDESYDPTISVDDKVIKSYLPATAVDVVATLDKGRIKLTYKERDGDKSKAIFISPNEYMKNISDFSGSYNETHKLLEKIGALDLNQPEDFRKAVDYIQNKLYQQPPAPGTTTTTTTTTYSSSTLDADVRKGKK